MDETYGGGVLFEVQDSLQGRPFLYLGFDLLKSMGDLEMRQIQNGVAFSGTPPAYEFNDDDNRQASYLSGNQSPPVSGQQEQLITLSENNVRKQLVIAFDTSLDWVSPGSPDRSYAILT